MAIEQLTVPVPFISVPDVATYLKNKQVQPDTSKAEIAGWMVANACQMIRERIGEVSPVEYREDVRIVNGVGVLTKRPVLSVPEGYLLESPEGLISGPDGDHSVTYTAGRGTPAPGNEPENGDERIPGNIYLAALEMAAHIWQATQNNRARGTAGPNDSPMMPSSTWALPIRVREMLGLNKSPSDMPFVVMH